MSTLTPANAGTLIEWLLENGFTREGDQPWFRKGRVRLVIEDPEGYFAIYVFDGADRLSWQAKYSQAPLDALTLAITIAQDTVRAELIPDN